MTRQRILFLWSVFLAVGMGMAGARDWPEWGGQASRNMVAPGDERLPDSVDCGQENNAGEVDLSTTKNVRWVARIGGRTTGSPVVSRGRVFIGTTWKNGSEACLLCFDEKSGCRLGAFICPWPSSGKPEKWSISSTPTIEGDRL